MGGKMTIKTFIKFMLVSLGLLFMTIGKASSELDELECPLDCECHYFRVNWVTDCSESNLTTIPYDWLSLNVYVLNMNGNNITELESFPEDIKLRRLEMADNQLTALKREHFKGLRFLLDADFSGNKITSIEPNSFMDSPGLLTLDLHNNPLTAVHGSLLVSRSLMYLDLSKCQLSHIPANFFPNITALHKLDLSENPLEVIDSGVFDNLTSLETLKLNRCDLKQISVDAFQYLENLKELKLSNNNLSTVDWSSVLASLTRLELLDLRNSEITHLPEDVFANNTWLRSLILAENELRDLDVATTLGHNLKHLETLDLANCQLKGPLSEDAFANATKLRTLLLNGNPMTASDLAVALRPLKKLHKLSLKNCGLTRLPGNTFHRYDHLQELDISRNPLNDAFTGLLAPLDTLLHLDMSGSNLTDISRTTFSKMNKLKKLILTNNHLQYLESGLFQNLTNLETLELNNCGLKRIPDASVFFNSTFSDLLELSLRSNPLDVNHGRPLFPKQLSKLEIVDLSFCNLTSLDEISFVTTPLIKTLKLSGNLFGGTTKENGLLFLHTLFKLENLDLSYNNVRVLSPEAFHYNRIIVSVNLVGNPWRCTCDVADLWNWAAEVRQEARVLVGSTTQPEEVLPNGGNKRKRGLTCSYASVDDIPKDRRYLKRMKDLTTNRTWAKYVKEAGCEVRRFVAEPTAEEQTLYRQMAIASISSYKQLYLSETPPRWLVTVVAIAVFYSLGIIITIVYVHMANKLKRSRYEMAEKARKEKELYEHEARLDLVRYLQHPRAGVSASISY